MELAHRNPCFQLFSPPVPHYHFRTVNPEAKGDEMAVRVEVEERVCTITIDRPEKHNAMDAAHYAMLSEAWIRVRDDPEILAAIITGAGDRTFTAGADLKDLERVLSSVSEYWLTQKDQLLNRGLQIWKPVIAAINGDCFAGGMTLMMATDIRIAVSEATFGITEVKRGLLAANGGTQRPLKQIPYAIAMEMLLTGDAISAQEALRWGLVNAVVQRDELLRTAHDYARRILRNGPLAVQATKELAIRSMDMSMEDGLRMEQLSIRHLLQTEDVAEGRAAFVERRAPVFRGR
jgi:E-phenylitaconyl-CoA hydratase